MNIIAADETALRRVAAALAADGDAVVELGRDDAWAARYRSSGQVEFLPPQARAQIGMLGAFARPQALADRVAVFDQAAIAGESILLRGGAAIESAEFIPQFLHGIYAAHPACRAAIAGCQAAETVWIDEPVFVPLHPWCKIYGHFLVEALPRLALIRDLHDSGFTFPIHVGQDAPRFIHDYLALALPAARLLRGRPGVVYRPRKVIVPNNDMPLLRLTARRVRFLEALAAGDAGAAPWRKLFLLRPPRPAGGYRFLANQDALRAVAEEWGYQAVAPETLTVAEQVRLFGAARCIAGEYSSALHNALLAPSGTAVVSFNWVNHYQLSIALARGQRLQVIAPEDGRFIDAQTRPAREYTICEAMFRTALRRCEPVAGGR
jgi:O-antigen biosynthesis protein WbqL